MKITKIKLKNFIDTRGQLVTVEAKKDIPFGIKRVYYIYDVAENERRGFHAHKKLKQILICLNGSCCVHLDNGTEQKEVLLNNPAEGLLIESNIWREMYNFSKGAVLLVLASELYDESDYIRDYDKFLEYIGENNG